ncbi:MAG TPA: GNAT family N-acetyltransferase [Mycobacteriales bacterium]|nr:GNAT family N-acetyltransferase [Mycobacteriales bacterium]
MSEVTVRAAGREDVDAVVESVVGLFREDAGRNDPTVNVHWPALEGAENYGALVADGDCLLAVARDDDRVVGHLVGKLAQPDSFRRQRVAVLESMRVHPDARDAGVGTLLVRHFLDWARDREAVQASVSAYAANEAALRFYARQGFAPMTITLRATL